MSTESDFALNAKFKVSKCTKYKYFNIDESTQIRIIKSGTKHAVSYRTILIKADEYGIFMPTNYIKNELGTDLKEAKLNAGRIYFDYINNSN